jgi:hypothetical protein
VAAISTIDVAQRAAVRGAILEAFVFAFRSVLIASAGLALAAAVVGALLPRARAILPQRPD